MNGTRFENVQEIQQNATRLLFNMPKTEFQEYFHLRKRRQIKFVVSKFDLFGQD